MPSEVLVEIFTKLPPTDLGRLGLVSHYVKEVSGIHIISRFSTQQRFSTKLGSHSEDNWIWRQYCKERFPFAQISRYGNSWKRCFASRSKTQSGWEGGRPGDFKMTALRAHKDYVSAFDYYRNNVVSGSADNTLQVLGASDYDLALSVAHERGDRSGALPTPSRSMA